MKCRKTRLRHSLTYFCQHSDCLEQQEEDYIRGCLPPNTDQLYQFDPYVRDCLPANYSPLHQFDHYVRDKGCRFNY